MKLGAKSASADIPTDSAQTDLADTPQDNLFGVEDGTDVNTAQAPSNDKPFDDEPFDAGVEADENSDPKKYIEQLTGKLGQSLRKYEDEQGSPDFELEKFAINSLLSATHTAKMNPEDQKDIIKKVKSSGQGDEDAETAIDSEETPEENPEVPEENPEVPEENPEVPEEDLNNLFEVADLNEMSLNDWKAKSLIKLYTDGDENIKRILTRMVSFSDSVNETEFIKDLEEDHDNEDIEYIIESLKKLGVQLPDVDTDIKESNIFLKNPPKNNMFQEGSNDILDEMKPCWKGYKQVGMKTKDGKEVPNCVPVNEAIVKRLHKMVNDLKLSENNRIFAQNEDMIEPATKPEVKPQTKPATTPEPKPLRKNKPFLPNVTPGIKTQPKAVTEGKHDYEIYHKTLNSAISQIEKYAMVRGFDPIEFGMFDVQHVAYGETKRISMPLTINGTPTKRMINAQIYKMDNGTYELNMYIG